MGKDIKWACGTVVNVLICEVRGHGFNAPQCMISERNGQPHCLNVLNKAAGRFRFSHHGGSMMLPPNPGCFGKQAWEILLQVDISIHHHRAQIFHSKR